MGVLGLLYISAHLAFPQLSLRNKQNEINKCSFIVAQIFCLLICTAGQAVLPYIEEHVILCNGNQVCAQEIGRFNQVIWGIQLWDVGPYGFEANLAVLASIELSLSRTQFPAVKETILSHLPEVLVEEEVLAERIFAILENAGRSTSQERARFRQLIADRDAVLSRLSQLRLQAEDATFGRWTSPLMEISRIGRTTSSPAVLFVAEQELNRFMENQARTLRLAVKPMRDELRDLYAKRAELARSSRRSGGRP